jgi:toluene monooxygenase system protein D
MNTTTETKLVGPVIRGMDEDIINAVIDAAEEDNPDKEIMIEDRGGYVRIQTDGKMRLTEASMVQALGRPFRLSELEPSLVSFAGHLETGQSEWEWSLHN